VKEVEEEQDEDSDDGLLILPAENSRQMSGDLIERQEQWLAQKQNKLYLQRREQESNLQNGLTFTPDTNDSRRSVSLPPSPN